MPKIEYVELLDELERLKIKRVPFKCCDPSATSFSILRAQLQGDINFSKNRVWLPDEQHEHEKKCRLLLQKAKSEYADLVLFPEYCISYDLLKDIMNEKRLWPDAMKLWCLPCQGIPTAKFESWLKNLNRRKNIILIDSLWDSSVNKSKFVNACFYCFRTKDSNNKECLCLAPQFKTQHMSDPTCKCEAVGLTTGTKIFTINHRLITLLCADALNNDIYWQDLQKQKLTNGLVLLHPQLNKDPKHKIFCRIRQEMQTHNHPGICITCNWAENTRIIPTESTSTPTEITLAWSCIYHKHQDMTLNEWRESRVELRQTNSTHGLFGAFMKKERMEVWFSPSIEQAILATIPNISSNQFGSTQIHGTIAEKQFFWSNNDCWQEQIFYYSLKERIEEEKISKKLGQISGIYNVLREYYRFPFDQNNKYVVDQFFSLTLPEVEDSVMTIDEQENLLDWTLLLDQSEYKTAIGSLQQLKKLTEVLQQSDKIPSRLKPLKGPHYFWYGLSESYRSNINTSDQKLLIIFAKSDIDARRIAQNMVVNEFSNNNYLAEKSLGVIYMDVFENEPHFLPDYSDKIDRGDNVIMEGDITNGGT